jgi:hypothetical protein
MDEDMDTNMDKDLDTEINMEMDMDTNMGMGMNTVWIRALTWTRTTGRDMDICASMDTVIE